MIDKQKKYPPEVVRAVQAQLKREYRLRKKQKAEAAQRGGPTATAPHNPPTTIKQSEELCINE